MGKEERMNSAQENIHKEPKAGGRSHTSGPGRTGYGDVKGAQEGGSAAEAGGMNTGTKAHLGKAMKELKMQHPEHHMDRGPHHGGKSHMRHMPGKY